MHVTIVNWSSLKSCFYRIAVILKRETSLSIIPRVNSILQGKLEWGIRFVLEAHPSEAWPLIGKDGARFVVKHTILWDYMASAALCRPIVGKNVCYNDSNGLGDSTEITSLHLHYCSVYWRCIRLIREFQTASSGSWWQDFVLPQGIFIFTAVRRASARTTAWVGRCLCLEAQVFDFRKICYWSHTDTFYLLKQFVYFQVGKSRGPWFMRWIWQHLILFKMEM